MSVDEKGQTYCAQCFKAGLYLQDYRLHEYPGQLFKFVLFKRNDKIAYFHNRKTAEEVLFFFVGKKE